MSDTKLQIQEAQRTQRKRNAENSTPRHIIFKLKKIKDNVQGLCPGYFAKEASFPLLLSDIPSPFGLRT